MAIFWWLVQPVYIWLNHLWKPQSVLTVDDKEHATGARKWHFIYSHSCVHVHKRAAVHMARTKILLLALGDSNDKIQSQGARGQHTYTHSHAHTRTHTNTYMYEHMLRLQMGHWAQRGLAYALTETNCRARPASLHQWFCVKFLVMPCRVPPRPSGQTLWVGLRHQQCLKHPRVKKPCSLLPLDTTDAKERKCESWH